MQDHRQAKDISWQRRLGYIGFGALLLVIVLGAVYSFVVFNNLREQAEEENLAADLAQAKLGAEFISDHQYGLLDRLSAIASRDQFKRIVKNSSYAEMATFLEPLSRAAKETEAVFLADPQGRLLFSLPVRAEGLSARLSLPLDDPQPWVSPVQPGPTPSQSPVVTLSVPVYGSDHKLAAFLGISQRSDLWRNIFSRLAARPGRTFFLFDQKGQLVTAGMDMAAEEAKAMLKGAQEVRQKVLASQRPVAQLTQLATKEEKAFVASARALPVGWVLTVAHGYEQAMSRTLAVVKHILIFQLLLFLCLLFLAFMLLSRYRGQQMVVAELDEETRRLEDMVHLRTEALRKTTEQYRSLVEDLPDIVYEVDAQRRFTFVSRSVTSILGYTPEEMLGRTRREFVHPKDRERYDRDRYWAQEGDMMNILAIRHLSKDGQVRWLSSHSRSLYNQEGQPAGRRGVARDVTQQVLAEMRVRELSRKLINAQEEERKRIALDLHDEMGQLLSALKMGLQAMAGQQGSVEGNEMEKLIRLNQTVMDRTRALAHWLRPAILDNFGLRAAVEDLCETLAESHLVQVKQRLGEVEERRLSPEAKISLFRFAQEALSNALKHSGSSLVEVSLAQDNHKIKLSVVDFGKGFDLEKALSGGKHLGLLGMKERLSQIGGKLNIISSAEGTRLSVELSLDGPL